MLATRLETPYTEVEGERVGNFILRQHIGEGGFGMVWMAEQMEPVKRMVALKVVKAGHGYQAGARPLRGRAPGPCHDEPPEHRQGARSRCHLQRAAVFHHGAGQGHSHHRFLRPKAARCPPTPGTVPRCLLRRATRPPERGHPPRPQAVERNGHPRRRQAAGEDHRLRHRQGHPKQASSREPFSRASASFSAPRFT